jgi:hypothetical protein
MVSELKAGTTNETGFTCEKTPLEKVKITAERMTTRKIIKIIAIISLTESSIAIRLRQMF